MEQDDAAFEDDLDRTRLSDRECEAVLDRLFPHGVAGPDVLGVIAPQGWEKSPLIHAFHPTSEQVFKELTALHRTLESVWHPHQVPTAPPTRADAETGGRSAPVRPEQECGELIGMCLWDLFSDNHDVIAADGRRVHLGSFRGTAGFIAEWLNRRLPEPRYDYLDFYMGSGRVSGRADLSCVDRMIFQRMRGIHLDWVYSFPRLHAVTFQDPTQEDAAIGEYDPSESLRKEEEARRKAEELAKLQADLDEAHLEALQEARRAEPPKIVRAYLEEYGHWPQGWPPQV